MITPEDQYLTEEELLERWRGLIKLATLRAWRSRSKGPTYVKLGRSVLYPVPEVVKYESSKLR